MSAMKALLTSSGITNASIEAALVDLLGKPISESTALIVPTGIYPFSVGPEMAGRLIRGEVNGRFAQLGWKSVGVLELSVLPTIDRGVWVPILEATDALLVWGGDPLFLSYWLKESGVADLLPSLDIVYVGTSAGAMAATTLIGETYTEPRTARGWELSEGEIVFEGGLRRTLITAAGIGLVDFSLLVHLDNPNHGDVSLANAAIWAARLPVPTYAIDEQTAIKVIDDTVDIVTEGHWKLFEPQ
jgi:dipeptidase E